MSCSANANSQMGKPKHEATESTKKLVSECLKVNRKAERERDRLMKEQQKEEERKQKLVEKERQREEKQAKKDAFEKEKEEKRLKRLEEQRKRDEEKESERRKKEEEKRKKDEERLQKEIEKKKEEEFKQKRDEKQRAVLLGFLVKGEMKKDLVPTQPTRNGPFMQFQLKKDMRIAPIHRVTPTQLEGKRANLDQLFISHPSDSTSLTASSLGLTKFGRTDFLHELRTKQHTPLSFPATWPTEPPDVQFLGEGVTLPLQRTLLRRPGTGGTGGTVWLRAKFLQFVENYRPAYYGTWRRRSYVVTGRRPFSKDFVELDYTVDSDDEWEEDEPGESITQSDNEEEDEEKEEEGEEEDEDDHFFVPHGYLSDDEGVSAEEPMDGDETGRSEEAKRLRRRLSCLEYEAAHKRGLQRLKRFLWGPVWSSSAAVADTLGNWTAAVGWDASGTPAAATAGVSPARCLGGEEEDKENVEFYCQANLGVGAEAEARLDPSLACDLLSVYRVHVWDNQFPISVSLDVMEPPVKTVTRRARKSLPDEAMPHFIQLVHRSQLNKRKLAFEFRLFWHRQTTGRLPECTSYNQFKRYKASTSGKKASTGPPGDKNALSQSLLWDGLALSQTMLISKINEIAIFEDGRWSVHPKVLRQFSSQLGPLCDSTCKSLTDMDDSDLAGVTLTAWTHLSDAREMTRPVRRHSKKQQQQQPDAGVAVTAGPDRQSPAPTEGMSPAAVLSPEFTSGRTPVVTKATPKRTRLPKPVPTTPELFLSGKTESPVSTAAVESVADTARLPLGSSQQLEQSAAAATATLGGGSAKKRLTLDSFFSPPSPKRTHRVKATAGAKAPLKPPPDNDCITVDSD